MCVCLCMCGLNCEFGTPGNLESVRTYILNSWTLSLGSWGHSCSCQLKAVVTIPLSHNEASPNYPSFQNSSVFFFFIFFSFIFYWRIIALQNFAVFCQTSTWISHWYTYITSLLSLPPIYLSIPRLWFIQSPYLSFWDI